MTFEIDKFLKKLAEIGISDIHLHVNEHPVVRKSGKIIKIDMPRISEEELNNIIIQMLPKIAKTKANSAYDLDFSYEIKGCSRFRVNLSHQLGKPALVIRNVPFDIKKPSELNLPASIEQFTNLNNGLVLVTGPTGSGKSTTLASIIDYINIKHQKHIVTIEDPIEFVFSNKKSIFSQRQVGIDTPTFADGIKYSLRQDPDVILIGEIRDRETIESALKAAETGHLVFATLHTNDAVQTINRIINLFEPSQREFVKKQVAACLQGTIAQKLVLSKDGTTRYPVCEVLVATPPIKDFIEKDKLEEIYELVKKGSFNSMTTMNMALFDLVEKDIITEEEAISKSDKRNELQQMFKGVYHGTKA